MELPEFFDKINHSQATQEKEYYFALQIWDEGVKSAVWTIENGESKVLCLGSKEFWQNEAELITSVDKSLSFCTEKLAGSVLEPNKVIFGLPDDWTSEDKILSQYQRNLSNICDKLDLKPAGFVSVFDALVYYLKKIEGSPTTAILVNPGRKFVYLAIVEVGKIIGVQKVGRSENLVADVYEGLSRFELVDSLPSRILLYDGEELESQRQILLNHSWLEANEGEKRLPFLHFPKIEILPPDSDVNAIAIAGGNEMAKSLGFETNVENQDSQSVPAAGEEPLAFGFVKNQDVNEVPSVTITNVKMEDNQPESLITPPPAQTNKGSLIKEKISWKLGHFPFPLIKLPGFSFRSGIHSRIGFIIILFFGLLLTIGGYYYWNFFQTEIIVHVSSKKAEKEINLIVDPNQEKIDLNNYVIPGQIIESEESGEKTTATTGEKTVGEKAKGEVTIYNRTDSARTFSEGVFLIGPGGVRFTIDREVNIASKTPDLISGVDKWGESKVTVTAADIGAQHNLAAQSQFTLKDYSISQFLAKNESSFAGGTSRQVLAVSEKDQKNLLSTLTDELFANAKKTINEKVAEESRLIEQSVAYTPASSIFSHKIGDESQELNLKLKIKINALSYRLQDLEDIASEILKNEIPIGYKIKTDEINTEFGSIEQNKDGSYSFKTKLTVTLMPEIKITELLNTIGGKPENKAIDFLKSNISGFEKAEFVYRPSVLSSFKIISQQTKNISLEIKNNQKE